MAQVHQRTEDSTPTVSRKRLHIDDSKIYALPTSLSFDEVARRFPQLKQYLIAKSDNRSTIDFGNADAVRALNRGLLYVYFDLNVTLPSNSLCPAIANRLSYIEWIKANIAADFPPESAFVGLDIGTGASCIYPLLGVRTMPQCTFVGTDINKESISVATNNVASNGLENRIKLYLVEDRNIKLPLDADNFPLPLINDDGLAFAFCMCNPPFYRDQQERHRLAKMKDCPPTLSTTGKDDELYTTGGEEEFLSGLVAESESVGKRIRWFSTMVGKKTTLAFLRSKIRKAGATFIREGLLAPSKTTRWVLAWTFFEQTRFSLDFPQSNVVDASKWLERSFGDLGIVMDKMPYEISAEAALPYYMCTAPEKSWTRQWRRQQKAHNAQTGGSPRVTIGGNDGTAETKSPELQFRVVVGNNNNSLGSTSIDMYLEPGYSSNIIKSLHGHLLKKIRDN
ncbi:hypothetical protein H4R24_003652 [Coemansia sp. RSA 988]|nr:hypothetical protein H4R24_003652 [Coemansia sp. RSA 988]